MKVTILMMSYKEYVLTTVFQNNPGEKYKNLYSRL
jgi:hypothetical protein